MILSGNLDVLSRLSVGSMDMGDKLKEWPCMSLRRVLLEEWFCWLWTCWQRQTTQSIAKKELSSLFHQRIVNFTNLFLKSCRHERMKAKNRHKVSQVMFCFFAEACHGLVEEQKWQICPPCSSATTTWYYNTMQLSTRLSELGCAVRYSVRPTARLD